MLTAVAIVFAAGCGGGVASSFSTGAVAQSVLAAPATAQRVVLVPTPAVTPKINTEPARSSDAFVDFIGVNTHFNYYGQVYDSASAETALENLGVRHIRDGPAFAPSLLTHFIDVASHGVHLDALWYLGSFPAPVSGWPVQPDVFANEVGVGNLDYYEGTNEPNFICTGRSGWASQVKAQQYALWQFMRNSTVLKTLPLLAPSYGNCGPWSGLINDAEAMGAGVASDSSFGNSHAYAGRNMPEAGGYVAAQSRYVGSPNSYEGISLIEAPGKPVVVTETGFGSNTSASDNGVGVVGQERYTLRELLNFWNLGVKRVYVYQLIENTTGSESYGLMNSSLVPNPAYMALKEFISILSDPGPPFIPGTLNYNLAASGIQIDHVLLEKRNGTFELILWQPVPSVDNSSNPLSITPQVVTLTFPTEPTSIGAHTFTDTGALTPLTVTRMGRVASIPVADIPVIVKITP